MEIKTFYDKKKYDCKYDGHSIEFKNKKSGKYIAKFKAYDLREIRQVTKNNQTHFLVFTKYDALADYKVTGITTELAKLFLDVHDFSELTDTCFKFYDGEKTVIYDLDKVSRYDDIYIDTLENNVVLVERIIKEESLRPLRDRLVYGVDINTHKIVTPIWSQLQQRMINLYTKEEREKWCKETGIDWYVDDDEFVIWKEVICEMSKIYQRLPLPRRNDIPSDYSLIDDEIYNDEGYLNEEFVKRFEIKKKF